MQKWLDEIQAHPLVVALVFFVVIFVAYNVLKKPATTAPPTGSTLGTGLAPGTGVGGPTGTELYNSQLYQYPVYQGPVVQNNPPAITPPSNVPGVQPPAQASPNNYFGILSQVGSEHPANIGPWIAGRNVQYGGGSYILKPGPSGHLYGTDKTTGKDVLLWNGNDWGPLGGSYGQHLIATTGGF